MSEEEWAKPQEPDPDWNRPRPDLPGDEWKRDPEQGSQPDHAPEPDTPEARWRRRLYAGPLPTSCPKCGHPQLRWGNDLTYMCLSCNVVMYHDFAGLVDRLPIYKEPDEQSGGAAE